ncbi:3-deoxy-D-manno-octulosonic acid transferase [Dyadobacter arcticus]|uniref:3-deoxy-D-manno-octulosonic acid transferase n=1 Tax=Dyadobacter arcticus TaxID=1078754 RepID=A0ABX0USV0_9BACT|nr:glycosyltransferase N-terminal domain-containing protein [Dyadobacter arcticus]NIJ55842.1 3-deoxy-D-manno-octulosonic-acid transferase [Dyadobacter arcticus]
MVEFIYQTAISLFASLLKFAAPFNSKAKLSVEGRKGLFLKLDTTFRELPVTRPVAWFHAASLGEFEQGRPVMEAYRSLYPDHFILLTFFSPSGYEIRKDYTGADYICYLPFDTTSNARRFVAIVKPKIAFFIKYEFWHNYLLELKKNNCIVLSFSSIFWAKQSFFKFYGAFSIKMLKRFDHIFVQNQESVDLLKAVGITSTIAGDTRFDRVKSIAIQARDFPEIAHFKDGQFCLIAGSVWEQDMLVLIPVLNQLQGKCKAIIAPHEIKKDQIESWRNELKGKTLLYSEMQANQAARADYLVIDNIGMLSSLYRYGDVAYIGGSFGAGLHNILEAATFGLPIIFGDKGYHRFQEAVDLLSIKGAVAVPDSTAAFEILNQWIEHHPAKNEAGKVSRDYVLSGTGATEKIMDKVKELM